MYDDDVQRLLIGPAVFASAVDDVLRRLSSCDTVSPRKVREMPARALLTSVVRVQQAVTVMACAGTLSYKASTILRAATRRVPGTLRGVLQVGPSSLVPPATGKLNAQSEVLKPRY